MNRHAIGAPCSPYLRKPLRSLHAACVEMATEHGLAAPPCGTCGLADLCGPAVPQYRLAPPRARRFVPPAASRRRRRPTEH